MSRYIVQTACEKMPSTCRGVYRKVAVLEVVDGCEKASMISEHSKDVIRIVREWRKLSVGKTPRSAFARAKAEADALCAELSA